MKQKTKNPQPLDLEEVYEQIKKWAIKEGAVSYEGATIQIFPTPKELVKKTITKIKQRLKSACEFYLRYKDKPELLNREKKILELKKLLKKLKRQKKDIIEILDKYNEWLFKLAFNFKEEK